MNTKKLGSQTAALAHPPSLISRASVVGRKEGQGPLADYFDSIAQDDAFGQPSWEKAESAMQKQALSLALEKAGLAASNLDWLFAGDLLNQCIGSSFAAREQDLPFFGLYGACSTMGEGLALASLTLDGGFGARAAVVVSSHFCSAERQYRTPLEYGSQRTPTAQWTVTGSGAVLLAREGTGPRVTHVTPGKIVDKGIKDTNNMGAAMAPAAADTIKNFLRQAGGRVDDYDRIFTGDLGKIGSALLKQLLQKEGINLHNHQDCGLLIYDMENQNVQSGASGCGCSGCTLSAYIMPKLLKKEYKKILFIATGALLSPTSSMQKESIPSIAHLVEICAGEGDI